MNIRDAERIAELDRVFRAASAGGALPGLAGTATRASLVKQIVESDRRNQFVALLMSRDISPGSADPANPGFDPLRAAIIQSRAGNYDEACWLVFLFVHFGKHRTAGYRYAREVYGALGSGWPWKWDRVSTDVGGFRSWLDGSKSVLIDKSRGSAGFGNHRKYESLDGLSYSGTGAIIESYVDWIGPDSSHLVKFDSARQLAGYDPIQGFEVLYRSMAAVRRFGRTARFDYLTTLSRVGLAEIRPGRCFLAGATGPLRGARLLFSGDPASHVSAAHLEERIRALDDALRLGFDVWEDALCNWQKSPARFKPFRG